MYDKLISIIVPIYNSDKYLFRCINSLIKQSYQNLEIILIDDGSTDNSKKICNYFLKKDKRIKFFIKSNGGVSSARNLGLLNAKGDYIAFVDSDDYIEADMLEKLLNSLIENESQISICNLIFEDHSGKELTSYNTSNCQFDRYDLPNKMYNFLSINGYVWNKLYDKNLIFKGSYTILFDENIGILEDNLFNYKIFENNSKFNCCYINEKLYHYVQNQKSTMNQAFSIKKLEQFEVREKQIAILEKNNINSSFLKAEYVISFCKEKIKMDILKIDSNKIIKDIEKKTKNYESTIDINVLNLRVKIKYWLAIYFPAIYKIQIIIRKENI